MGFSYRRSRSVGANGRLNFSKSGVSYSHAFGQLTLNSRGRGTGRFGRGMSYRTSGVGTIVLGIVAIAITVVRFLWTVIHFVVMAIAQALVRAHHKVAGATGRRSEEGGPRP